MGERLFAGKTLVDLCAPARVADQDTPASEQPRCRTAISFSSKSSAGAPWVAGWSTRSWPARWRGGSEVPGVLRFDRARVLVVDLDPALYHRTAWVITQLLESDLAALADRRRSQTWVLKMAW